MMTITEKRSVIDCIFERVTSKIWSNFLYFPENWDAVELAQYIADKFQEESIFLNRDTPRKKAYKNDCLVFNL